MVAFFFGGVVKTHFNPIRIVSMTLKPKKTVNMPTLAKEYGHDTLILCIRLKQQSSSKCNNILIEA